MARKTSKRPKPAPRSFADGSLPGEPPVQSAPLFPKGAQGLSYDQTLARGGAQPVAAFRARLNEFNRRGQGPLLYAEGDSWFDFPWFLVFNEESDLLDSLMVAFGYRVERNSKAGDTVANMTKPSNLALLKARLQQLQPAAFLFSGGGNDLFACRSDGGNVLYDVLRPRPAGAHVAPAHAVDTAAYDRFINSVILPGYERVLDVARHAAVPLVIHGYAYARPTGRKAAFKVAVGPWMRQQFRKRGYSPDTEGPAIMDLVVDRMNTALQAFAGASGGRAHYVDLRPVIGDDDWHDELHLHPHGWRKTAREVHTKLQSIIPRTRSAASRAASPRPRATPAPRVKHVRRSHKARA